MAGEDAVAGRTPGRPVVAHARPSVKPATVARRPAYGLPDLIGSARPPTGLLEAALALWDGHPTPALWGAAGWPRGWHPAPAVTRARAWTAHLVGVARAGSYPFRGILPACGCPARQHACAGVGATYACWDVDAHRGEQDVGTVAGRLLAGLRAYGIRPLACSSRSGTGLHIFAFLDGPLPTDTIARAGAWLRAEAGAAGRCDVIPSGQHQAGLGTLHGLPLAPADAPHGGGLVLDGRLRPIRDPAAILAALVGAHQDRTPACLLGALARAVGPPARPARRDLKPENPPTPADVACDDGPDARFLRARHPQVVWAASSSPADWRGRASTRDACLAAMLVRAGLDGRAAADALLAVPASKAGLRDESYRLALATWQAAAAAPTALPLLPGMPVRYRRDAPVGPDPRIQWRDRILPPATCGPDPNPFWRPDVLDRLLDGASRSRLDAPMLAFLIAFWDWGRGIHPRRLCFLGAREAAGALAASPRAVLACWRRLAGQLPDVIRIVRGLPHPHLRLATAFAVLALPGSDPVAWHVPTPDRAVPPDCFTSVPARAIVE